jgi:hypothetical protein
MKDRKLKAWTELHGGLATKHEQVGGQWYVRGLQDASSPAKASRVACSAIVQQLAKRLAMAPETLDSNRTMVDYGIKSLLSVEPRN